MRQENEREEEIYVRKLLGDRYGACLRKIPKSKQEGIKTPDYELLVTNTRVTVLEVKCWSEPHEPPENGWQVRVSSTDIREATRIDNAPQRVSKIIHEIGSIRWKLPKTKSGVF